MWDTDGRLQLPLPNRYQRAVRRQEWAMVTLALISLALVALLFLYLLRPHPALYDRYAEQWGGKNGESLALTKGVVLPLPVGHTQMFTPAVAAPAFQRLTHVQFEVCVPASFVVDLLNTFVWMVDEIGRGQGCAFYWTQLGTIERGHAMNPPAALFFHATTPGRRRVAYRILSYELAPEDGYFDVEVR